MSSEFAHGIGCLGCDDAFASALVTRLRHDHAEVISHLDESALLIRVRTAVAQTLRHGFSSSDVIAAVVILMFVLEPGFERRFRVREHFKSRASTSDEETIRNLVSGSHPNCWYRADAAIAEQAWQVLANDPASLVHPRVEIRQSCSGLPMLPIPQLSPDYGFQLDAPYVETPSHVVDAMLTLAETGPMDVVMDLGCGDGRIVITAAAKFGARGIGIDLDPENVERARHAAAAAGVSDRVTFVRSDLYDADVSEATVVTLYLLRHVNLDLRDRLRTQLRSGARIVSRHFDMEDWEPRAQRADDMGKIYCWWIDRGPGT